MRELKFPKLVKAVSAAEFSQWAVGDALISEIGKPQEEHGGTHNGTRKKIVAASAELFGLGYTDYTDRYLALLREVAWKFRGCRLPGISWKAHHAAGTPDNLKVIAKMAKAKDKRVTLEFVMAARQAQYKVELAQREKARQAEEAQREAAEREVQEQTRKAATAQDERERETARTKAREAKERADKHRDNAKAIPPARQMRGEGKPREEDVPALLVEMEIGRDIEFAAKEVADLLKRITPELVSNMRPEAVDAARESSLAAMNNWKRIAEVLGKTTGSRRGHLFAVGE